MNKDLLALTRWFYLLSATERENKKATKPFNQFQMKVLPKPLQWFGTTLTHLPASAPTLHYPPVPSPQMLFFKAYPFPLTQVITFPSCLLKGMISLCYFSLSANKDPAKFNKSIAPNSTNSYYIPFLYSPL